MKNQLDIKEKTLMFITFSIRSNIENGMIYINLIYTTFKVEMNERINNFLNNWINNMSLLFHFISTPLQNHNF